ncbi:MULTISPECIES: hypothetical protein [unclassified Streptomyces]|uniref:hypothetical protein n=1 Tax=unclassified Streptomyces TaxID=2593676 RepID=UPI000399AC9A|nr:MULTISPECIES: hypothetical protein [unclassified Streptomyces]
MWFDAGDGNLHASALTGAGRRAIEATGAVAHAARHTSARLDEVTRAIGRWGKGLPGLLSWGPDVRTNRVRLVVDPARTDARTTALRGRLAELGAFTLGRGSRPRTGRPRTHPGQDRAHGRLTDRSSGRGHE